MRHGLLQVRGDAQETGVVMGSIVDVLEPLGVVSIPIRGTARGGGGVELRWS